MSEKKKLTDEEILEALEKEKRFLLEEQSRTGNTPDTQLVYVKGEAVFKILDLIHRLQEDNKNYDRANSELMCTIAEQKAEIERLTEESNEMFDRHAKENQAASLLIEKRNNEIERLTEERDKLKVIVDHNCDPFPKWQEAIIKENAKLQKQVDELTAEKNKYQEKWQTAYMNELNLQKQVNALKAENTELYKEHTTLIAGSILKKQNIAKDKAKEILTELDLFFKGTTFRKGYEFKKIDEKLKEIAKRNGVEVE